MELSYINNKSQLGYGRKLYQPNLESQPYRFCYASGAFISAKLIFKLKDVDVLHCVQPVKQGYNESYDFIKFNGKIMVSCDINCVLI